MRSWAVPLRIAAATAGVASALVLRDRRVSLILCWLCFVDYRPSPRSNEPDQNARNVTAFVVAVLALCGLWYLDMPWAALSGTATGYLVNRLRGSPDSSSILLAAGCAGLFVGLHALEDLLDWPFVFAAVVVQALCDWIVCRFFGSVAAAAVHFGFAVTSATFEFPFAVVLMTFLRRRHHPHGLYALAGALLGAVVARLRWEARLQTTTGYSGVASAATSILSAVLCISFPSGEKHRATPANPLVAAGAGLAILSVAL